MDAALTAKLEPVLQVDYMSSDESIIQSEGSDDECIVVPKKFRVNALNWRSTEFQKYIDSLDRKVSRNQSERSKRMSIPTELGGPSTRQEPPDGYPDWACITFD